MRAWIVYSVVRVGIFAGILALLLLLRIEWWIAAIAAALMALAISFLALDRLRGAAAAQLATAREQRSRSASSDEDAEDQ